VRVLDLFHKSKGSIYERGNKVNKLVITKSVALVKAVAKGVAVATESKARTNRKAKVANEIAKCVSDLGLNPVKSVKRITKLVEALR
jgi:hypothetical protein